MFSLAELQNKKATLKRRPASPGPKSELKTDPRPNSTLSHGDPPTTTTSRANTKTNIPLPTLSLQTLASARGGLNKVSLVKPSSAKVHPALPLSPGVDNQDQSILPAFSSRKELFEKKKSQVSNSLPTAVEVHVGDEANAKTFTVNIKTLRSSSRFRDELCSGSESFTLSGHSPIAFQLFLDFCEHPCEPVKYQPGQYSKEPWVSSSAAAYVLSLELRARRFERYALSQFIQNCAIIARGPWAYIERYAATDSALSRFSRHWIAWNVSFSNWWTHEYIGLEAASLADNVTPETRDPRLFELVHWYQDCGTDLSALCEHNPIHWKRQQERAARESRPAPAEWGKEDERKAKLNYHERYYDSDSS